MRDSTNREIEPGDIVLSHETGSNNWSNIQLFIVAGGETPKGRVYVLNMYFRRIYVTTNRLIKITPEFAQELFDAGRLFMSEAQFSGMLEGNPKKQFEI